MMPEMGSSIVALGDATEALALRAVLESMGHDVRLLRPSTPAHVPAALKAAAQDDLVIFSAQGGPKGFRMSPSDGAQDAVVTANAAFKGVSFRADSVLISTAAATRESGLVQVMLNAGGHLVAPNGTPDRAVIVPWVGACLLGAHNGLAEAVTAANGLVALENRFSYG